jgi:hypothetical protein
VRSDKRTSWCAARTSAPRSSVGIASSRTRPGSRPAQSDLGWFACDLESGEIIVRKGAPKGARRALAKVKRTITHRTIGRGADAERITTVTAEFALWNKPEALLKAGQHTGAFDDERLDVDALRDLLGALATITQRTLEELLPPDVATRVIPELGARWHGHVSAQYPQVAIPAHSGVGDAVDPSDLGPRAA